MIKLSLNLPLSSFGLNEATKSNRGNYYNANKIKKSVQELVLWQCKSQNITNIPTPTYLYVKWHVVRRSRDLDNLLLKNILDALQGYKALKNDNLNHVVGITHDWSKSEIEGADVYFCSFKEYIEMLNQIKEK